MTTVPSDELPTQKFREFHPPSDQRRRVGHRGAADDAFTPAESAELAALSADGRLTAEAAAVAGDPFEPGLVAAIAALPEGRLLAALDELLDHGTVVAATEAGTFRYRTARLRRKVYAATPAGWRFGAHTRAAQALRSLSAPGVRFAEHVERASRVGDEDAVAVLTDAAGTVETRSPAVAADWYRAALRLVPDLPANRARRRGLRAAAIRSSGRAGRFGDCAALLADDDVLDEEAWSARLALHAGDIPAARELLHRRVAENPMDPVPWLLLTATTTWDRPDADGYAWSDEAVLTAAGSDDQLLRAQALALHATVRLAGGATDQARRSGVAAADLVAGLPESTLAARLDVLVTLGWLELHLERYEPAAAHFARGIEIAGSTGQGAVLAGLLVGLGTLSLRRGDLISAAERAEHALALSSGPRRAQDRATALWLRAQVRLATGESAGAQADCDAAAALLPPGSAWSRQVSLVRAAAHLAEGNARECVTATAVAAAEQPAEAGFGSDVTMAAAFLPAWSLVTLADLRSAALRALGVRDEPAAVAADAAELATAHGLPGRMAVALLAARRADASPVQVLTQALEAVGHARTAGHRLDEARARTVAAEALLALDDPHDARDHLIAAAHLADDCGATALAAVVQGLLPEVEQAQGKAPVLLSHREYEIAELVSAGRTNRQIARLLDLSHKTVETHLGRIFVKLEVSSRAEIATLVGRAGVVGRPKPVPRSAAG